MDEELVKKKIAQAEEQQAYWTEQQAYAARQVAMWQGAMGALRDLLAELTAVEEVGEEESAG